MRHRMRFRMRSLIHKKNIAGLAIRLGRNHPEENKPMPPPPASTTTGATTTMKLLDDDRHHHEATPMSSAHMCV